MQGCGNKDFCPFDEFKVNTPLPPNVLQVSYQKKQSAFPCASHLMNVSSLHNQEKIVQPHVKHDFDVLCKIKKPVVTEEPSSFSSKLSNFFLASFSRKGYHVKAQDMKTEL